MQDHNHQSLSAEVLEMGEQLFALALEGHSSQPAQTSEEQPFPLAEIEAASREFFSALRLLLLQSPSTNTGNGAI